MDFDWFDKINKALDYIEARLTEEIDLSDCAHEAFCSADELKRVFKSIVGISVSAYIKRRRMSLAAADLSSGTEKIIDIGLKYGYSSPTSFIRAFRSIHFVTPSEIRQGGRMVKYFPRVSVKLKIIGEKEMNYRIEQKGSFRIVGISIPLKTAQNGNYEKVANENMQFVPKFWQRAMVDGTISKLNKFMNDSSNDGSPMGVLGACCCHLDEWKYYIAVASDKPIDDTCSEFSEYIVPASTWAIFPGSGFGVSIQNLETEIHSEWLPSSGFKYGKAPEIEIYLTPDADDGRYELWLPIEKV